MSEIMNNNLDRFLAYEKITEITYLKNQTTDLQGTIRKTILLEQINSIPIGRYHFLPKYFRIHFQVS